MKALGLFLLCLAFLWGCFLLRLHKYGETHVDAFQTFLKDKQCYAFKRVEDPNTHRKYTSYHCASPSDDVDLYDMPKGER